MGVIYINLNISRVLCHGSLVVVTLSSCNCSCFVPDEIDYWQTKSSMISRNEEFNFIARIEIQRDASGKFFDDEPAAIVDNI